MRQAAAFQTLAIDLQQFILARAGAPFTPCQAAAPVLKDARLLATWLQQSVQHPLITASQPQAWDACTALLGAAIPPVTTSSSVPQCLQQQQASCSWLTA
jgi:hypothetical protein